MVDSKELAPKWAEAARRAKLLNPPVPLAKVDATANEALAERYDVSGYPTIKLIVDGKAEEYNGGRDADAIVAVFVAHVDAAVFFGRAVTELVGICALGVVAAWVQLASLQTATKADGVDAAAGQQGAEAFVANLSAAVQARGNLGGRRTACHAAAGR